MHPTLHIPELVGAVFRNLDPSWTEDAQLQDLAVLARTCTGFHDIALDALWRHQYGILNLIRCMPADLWEVVEADAPQNNRPARRILVRNGAISIKTNLETCSQRPMRDRTIGLGSRVEVLIQCQVPDLCRIRPLQVGQFWQHRHG